MKCGSNNLLETSGPVQACVGIALSFRFTYNVDIDVTVMSELYNYYNSAVHLLVYRC